MQNKKKQTLSLNFPDFRMESSTALLATVAWLQRPAFEHARAALRRARQLKCSYRGKN